MRLDSWFLRPCCAIAPAILDIVALFQDFYVNVRFSAFSVLGKLSEQAEFRAAIAGVIPAIVALLKDSHWRVLTSTLSVLGMLSEQGAARENGMGIQLTFDHSRILPTIVALLRDSDSDVPSSAVWVLGKYSEKAEFRAAIAGVIPAIVVLFKQSDSDVRSSAVSVLGKVSEQGAVPEQAEFRAAIAPDIPTIVALLKDSDNNVRSSASSALVNFSEQEEFLPLVRAAICAAVGLSDKTQPTLPESLSIPLQRIPTPSSFPSRSDRFRDNPANVPHIRDLSGLPTSRMSHPDNSLRNNYCPEFFPSLIQIRPQRAKRKVRSDSDGRCSAYIWIHGLADAFGTAVTRAIFEIVALLKDSDWRSIKRSIGPGEGFRASRISRRHCACHPAIVTLLKDSDSDVRSSVVSVLGKVSEQAEFRAAIATAIPHIVALLQDYCDDVRSSTLSVLEKVSEQSTLTFDHSRISGAIVDVIPATVALLRDSGWRIRSSTVLVLGKLSVQAEFRAAIAPAIPDIIAWLKDFDSDVRSSAVSVLGKVLEQAEFRPAIVALLKDSGWVAF
ncbi:armadillo-type protein [Hysterangium stoloniferum]|nr:armadillo-type protein [Hysterangium stoloniferum]